VIVNSTRLGRHLQRVIGGLLRTDPKPVSAASTTHHIPIRQAPTAVYPGDFTGTSTVLYEPIPDASPDPGEIVWTRVVFEEDYQRGKDRPVLVIGRDEPWLLALMLTSKDHDRDAAIEARHGRVWLDVGTGAWDSQRRPSEIRIDRVLRLDPAQVRRDGGTLDRARFDLVADQVRSVDGWS
jgi:PemK-like, MazF-like toxin of type II toxin-antitoxin system